MSAAPAHTLEAPPPELRFRRRVGVVAAMRELWHSRELVRTMAERELRARYKQAILGFAWAVVTPLALTLLLTLVFNRVGNVNIAGVPYSLYAYVGLLPWTFFSTSMSHGGMSLITNMSLVNRIYCPREVFPIASMVVAGFDFVVSLIPAAALFLIFSFAPKATSVWLPVVLPVQILFTMGCTLLVAGAIVFFRDVRHALPIVLQLGLFATPIAYPLDRFIPEAYQWLYALVNPMAAVVEGYQRTVLLGQAPDWKMLLAGGFTSVVVFLLGYRLFKRMETGFADVT
jgi:ABC-type polysaccharide/polyol phosphate export permease